MGYFALLGAGGVSFELAGFRGEFLAEGGFFFFYLVLIYGCSFILFS